VYNGILLIVLGVTGCISFEVESCALSVYGCTAAGCVQESWINRIENSISGCDAEYGDCSFSNEGYI
jgi:hypothetical protein